VSVQQTESTDQTTLAFILSIYRGAASQQVQTANGLDTKTGVILAYDGALAGFLLVGHHGTAVAVILVFVSLATGAAALLTRRFVVGPHPDFLYTHYGGNPLPEVESVAIVLYSEALEFNRTHLAWKVRFLLASTLAVVIAVASLTIQVWGVAR
jgi:hypothetical protein